MTQIDFKWRGGMAMARRRTSPSFTRPSCQPIWRMCQLAWNGRPGSRVVKPFWMKDGRSYCSGARSTRWRSVICPARPESRRVGRQDRIIIWRQLGFTHLPHDDRVFLLAGWCSRLDQAGGRNVDLRH